MHTYITLIIPWERLQTQHGCQVRIEQALALSSLGMQSNDGTLNVINSGIKDTVLCIWGLWGRFFKTALFKKLMINTIFRWHHQVSIPCRYCTFSYFVQIKQILNMMSKELSGLQSVVMVN